ncbi:MAG: phage major capsid protein [Pseudomonadota bacterium]
MTVDQTGFETKAHAQTFESDHQNPSEHGVSLDGIKGTFEAFKDANDARLNALEERGHDDVVLREKINRINTAMDRQQKLLDQLALKGRRPSLGQEPLVPDERKEAFLRYVRAGDASALHTLEAKSLSTTSDPEGGYLAPLETERRVTSAMRDVSPLRTIATVREIGANTYRKPVSLGGAAAGWVGETDARPETASPTLAAIDFPTMELYAMPAASQTLLDDAVVDIEQWLADEIQGEFAAQEGAAFINGNGVNQPTGILSYPIVDDQGQAHGQVGAINTGVDGGFDASAPVDTLLDLIYAPRQTYRGNASFVMNRSTISEIRKLKDADGTYIWQPASQPGTASTLLGYPVVESEDMPAISTGSTSIAFGDFARGYLIVDRVGLRVLRDPFSAKPYVLFYTTKRVGGGIQDFDAIKLLRFAA